MSDAKHKKIALNAAKHLLAAAEALGKYRSECTPPNLREVDDSPHVLKMDMLEFASFLERKYGEKP